MEFRGGKSTLIPDTKATPTRECSERMHAERREQSDAKANAAGNKKHEVRRDKQTKGNSQTQKAASKTRHHCEDEQTALTAGNAPNQMISSTNETNHDDKINPHTGIARHKQDKPQTDGLNHQRRHSHDASNCHTTESARKGKSAPGSDWHDRKTQQSEAQQTTDKCRPILPRRAF